MLWIIVAFFLLFAVGLMALPVSLRITYSRKDHDDHFVVAIKLWPGIRYRLVIGALDLHRVFSKPAIKYRAELKTGAGKKLAGEKNTVKFPSLPRIIEMITFWFDVIKELKPSLKHMLGKIRLEKFCWNTGLGVGDPFYAGLLTGLLWGLEGLLSSLLYHGLPRRAARPQFSVVPYFNRKGFAVFFDCIVSTRIGHIIFTGLSMVTALILSGKLMKIVKKIKKRNKG